MVAGIPTEHEATDAHEAGHAVMRSLRGLPATSISLIDDRLGECGGTGEPYPAKDVLLVTLAGYAAESAFGTAEVDFSGACDDFDYARSLLASVIWLRDRSEALDHAIQRYFLEACELLRPHANVIRALQDALLTHGWVSAEAVATICAAPRPRRSINKPVYMQSRPTTCKSIPRVRPPRRAAD